RERGLVCVTAGNHGAAVAWAAAQVGAKATVVMPTYSPAAKVAACWSYGAEVVLHGDTTTEAFAECERLQRERGLTFVHPFDDPEIVAGQGTVGLELTEDAGPVDVWVVSVGGGGRGAGGAAPPRCPGAPPPRPAGWWRSSPRARPPSAPPWPPAGRCRSWPARSPAGSAPPPPGRSPPPCCASWSTRSCS